MTGRVETADGKVYELPALLEWRLRRTGGVPCDSFRVKCLYSAEMGEALKAACRFAATENGVTRFRGVIDEWSAVCGAEGTVLTVEGRGMAALLLDNEAEAVTYQRAALSEILKDHAAACGVAWEPHGEVYGTGEYAVASGSSRWKAIEGFARRCGLTPYFTREGVLCLRGAAEGRRLVLEEPEGVIEASYRDRRYGVLSEVTAVNRAKKLRQTVRNEAFLARGGSCRRVVYVPSRSVNELRYTGRYQIEKSAEDAREQDDLDDGEVRIYAEDGSTAGVLSRGEERNVPLASPGGYAWRPKNGERVLVIKGGTLGEERYVAGSLDAAREQDDLDDGEVRIYAEDGGASITLRRNGHVEIEGGLFINGAMYVPPVS